MGRLLGDCRESVRNFAGAGRQRKKTFAGAAKVSLANAGMLPHCSPATPGKQASRIDDVAIQLLPFVGRVARIYLKEGRRSITEWEHSLANS